MMKYENYDKEMSDNNHSLLEEDMIKNEEKKISLISEAIIYSTLTIISSIIANIFSFFIFIGLVFGIITLIKVKKIFKKEYNTYKKLTIQALVISIIGIIICLVPSFEYVDRYVNKLQFPKEYEKILNIDLPDRKVEYYEYDIGYKSNIKYQLYRYEISKDEYDDLITNIDMISVDVKSYYIDNLSANKDNGYYLFYDFQNKVKKEPTDKLNYQYILMMMYEKNGKLYLEIYDVQKRKY